MKYINLVHFACFFLICYGEKDRFDNYRVYNIEVNDDAGLGEFQKLEESSSRIVFLNEPNIHQPFQILVPPDQLANITELFKRSAVKTEVQHENFQKLIDEEQPHDTAYGGHFGWDRYHDLDVIYAWLDEMLQKYSSVLKNHNYGKSVEGRALRAVKLSKKEGNPTIFIESTIHAREWVTVATATYFLNELLTSDDGEIRKLANNYDWVFVPVVNVDGFAYSHSNNRMWRKTRKPHSIIKFCVGSDPNRNFDFHHGDVGASTNPCAETYAGPSPFSEPETLALSEFIETFDNIKLYISFHSYSQLLLFPYGHSKEHTPNHKDLNQIGQKTKQAIAKRYGTQYKVGNIAEAIYLASGSTIDWVYATRNVSLTYTFEFRDKGRYGFLLPADQIIPNSLEVIDGLKAMVEEAEALQYL
ncbi:zinc carboxypeptidase-like [Sitodiplosis mosellana]|uniref:zinc carboxypeptidase-like n=1 Tax=Sitodiplosis mosellana TaxID=263140 RepID=UPI0024450DF0|nr:zinc carboxypeptidase-like [Sitodiplosis mosellana]